MFKKALTSIIAILLCMSVVASSVSAASLSNITTNASQAGWTLRHPKYHMGVKASTYAFSTQTYQEAFGSDFQSGIALWGSNITMTRLFAGSSATVQ